MTVVLSFRKWNLSATVPYRTDKAGISNTSRPSAVKASVSSCPWWLRVIIPAKVPAVLCCSLVLVLQLRLGLIGVWVVARAAAANLHCSNGYYLLLQLVSHAVLYINGYDESYTTVYWLQVWRFRITQLTLTHLYIYLHDESYTTVYWLKVWRIRITQLTLIIRPYCSLLVRHRLNTPA